MKYIGSLTPLYLVRARWKRIDVYIDFRAQMVGGDKLSTLYWAFVLTDLVN